MYCLFDTYPGLSQRWPWRDFCQHIRSTPFPQHTLECYNIVRNEKIQNKGFDQIDASGNVLQIIGTHYTYFIFNIYDYSQAFNIWEIFHTLRQRNILSKGFQCAPKTRNNRTVEKTITFCVDGWDRASITMMVVANLRRLENKWRQADKQHSWGKGWTVVQLQQNDQNSLLRIFAGKWRLLSEFLVISRINQRDWYCWFILSYLCTSFCLLSLGGEMYRQRQSRMWIHLSRFKLK